MEKCSEIYASEKKIVKVIFRKPFVKIVSFISHINVFVMYLIEKGQVSKMCFYSFHYIFSEGYNESWNTSKLFVYAKNYMNQLMSSIYKILY